jgi:hypothetical protein
LGSFDFDWFFEFFFFVLLFADIKKLKESGCSNMDIQNLDSLSTQQSMPDAHGLSPASESQLQAFPESTTLNCPRGFVWWQQPPNSMLDPTKYRHHDHGPPELKNNTLLNLRSP